VPLGFRNSRSASMRSMGEPEIDVMWELEDDLTTRMFDKARLCLMGMGLGLVDRFLGRCGRELHTIYGVVRTFGAQGLANEHGVTAVSALDVALCGRRLAL
jgi:hypothetical protein